MEDEWSPSSWRSRPVKQQPEYHDHSALENALNQVRCLPPLVTPQEVESLRDSLAEVAEGKRFLLQGGDCAERFLDCSSEPIEKKLRILLQMSLVLTWGARIPTLRIARMAGQFSKPRSQDYEIVDGKEVPVFRGDNINSFDESNRSPDPNRLVMGYFHSAATLNYTRALLSTGLADLKASSNWDLGFIQDREQRLKYKSMVDKIMSAMEFVSICEGISEDSLRTAEIYMSHEGLHLPYEEALTRPIDTSTVEARHSRSASRLYYDEDAVSTPELPTSEPSSPNSSFYSRRTKKYYNLGTHFLWIGDRTRQLDHAHIEYFRGIANPIGFKAGPSSDPAEIVEVIRTLWPNPKASPGKIAIITRFGADLVKEKLPPLIKAVRDANFSSPVVWICDPMHGNTFVASNGYKTRNFNSILGEITQTFMVHKSMGSLLGGVHFELTGENVTECTGGPEGLCEGDLPQRYTTYCDPRLNYAQGMEMAFLLAEYLMEARGNERTVTNWGSSNPEFTHLDNPEVTSEEVRKIRLGSPHLHEVSDNSSSQKNELEDLVL